MKANLKELYKKLNTSHPFLGLIVRRLYYRKPLNSITRKIYGTNNLISQKNAILNKITLDIDGNNNSIQIMKGCILNHLTFYIRGNNHSIVINENCFFARGTIWFEDSGCTLFIGERSTFQGEVHLALTEPGSRLSIGRDCMFSSDIDIRTGDSHSIISQESKRRINYAMNVDISDHVWIGAHSIILKGSSIPENSVVATGSVVTRRFETKGIIIGGNPAIQLKEGITWSRERIYETRDETS